MHPAFRLGVREALGAQAVAMAATFIAFGAAVHAAGFGLGWGLFSSAGIYGMAGQMVLLGARPGASAAAVAGSLMANARFLPMAASLAPLVRGRLAPLCVPFISITPWAAAMRRLPDLPAPDRPRWFVGFGVTVWTVGLVTTALGHSIAGYLSPPVLRLLLMLNVLYFALLIAAGVARGGPWRASLAGAVVAPFALLLPEGVPPAWGLLGASLIGGTAAFLLRKRP